MSRLRHRELLLSLKYSTIEACFSVPMLNLTLPSFSFVIAFAVTALGWGPAQVGLMAALPHLCNLVQPLLATWLRQRLALHTIVSLTFLFNAAPWGFVSLLPYLQPGYRDLAFGLILVVATMANSLGGVSWSAAIAEVVPPRLSGRFFGRRNLIFGFWTLVTVIVATHLAERGHNTLATFGMIFAVAGLGRLAGYFFLTRMKFPQSVMQLQPEKPAWSELAAPLRDRNYLRLALFIGLWGMLLNLGQPFYPMFLLQVANRPVGDVGLLAAVAGVGALLTLKGWGKLCDHFGVKPVLYVCSLIWGLTAMASWICAGEKWYWHLAGTYLVVGGMTAGFQLCQFNLMLKLAPANKSPYVAIFLALTSAMTAVGPLLGGLLLRLLPDHLGVFLGQPIRDYHLLFAGSMLGCLLVLHLLDRVREDEAQPPEAVWRTMRTMPAFNPMLFATTAAQVLLTPRGLLGLTRTSVRSLRRHARAIGDVGEELVEGTTEAVRSKLPGDKKK